MIDYWEGHDKILFIKSNPPIVLYVLISNFLFIFYFLILHACVQQFEEGNVSKHWQLCKVEVPFGLCSNLLFFVLNPIGVKLYFLPQIVGHCPMKMKN